MYISSELIKLVNIFSMYIVYLRLFNFGFLLTFIMVGSEGLYILVFSKFIFFDWKYIYMLYVIMLKK